MEAVNSENFFSGKIPHGIPPDAPKQDISILAEKLNELNGLNYPLTELKKILLHENTRLGAGIKTRNLINSIDINSVFVVAGQQAGLFGGPLYTFYKAMHCVRLSNILTEKSEKKVIPVFWVASDDHDFTEVKSLGIPSKNGEISSITYVPDNYQNGMPVGEIIIDEKITDTIENLKRNYPASQIYEEYFHKILSSWKPGEKWSGAFAIQLLSIFDNYGIVLIDPRWKGIKKLFKNVMTSEIINPLLSTQYLNIEAENFVNKFNKTHVIKKPANSTNLFFEIDNFRYPLLYENKMFKAGGDNFSEHEILNMLDLETERFSPAAALRPLCQDSIMPVCATIAGPGERTYLTQIKPIYTHLKVPRSEPWPRASFTIIDQRIKRIAEKEKLSLQTLFRGNEKIIHEILQNTLPEDIENALKYLERNIINGFDTTAEKVGGLDSTLAESVKTEKGKVIFIINKIKEKVFKALKEKTDIKRERLFSASYFLMPENKPQERWFGIDSIIPFLAGDGFEQLLKLTSPGEENHRIVY